MPNQNRIVCPGKSDQSVTTLDGEALIPPDTWIFLKAGDAPLTRLVKQRTITWQVQFKRGKRTMNKGIWADQQVIIAAQQELAAKRESPAYQKKRETELKRKAKKHQEYVDEFYKETAQFLNFHPKYSKQAELLAQQVTELATPIGSGTVARTKRIPLPKRVEAAVIAWLRHATTRYDTMSIARIKGERRRVRRELAKQSLQLLENYRSGGEIHSDCPLQKALAKVE